MPQKGQRKIKRRKLYDFRHPDRQIIAALADLRKQFRNAAPTPGNIWEKKLIAVVTDSNAEQSRMQALITDVLNNGNARGLDPKYCVCAWLLTRELVAWRNSSTMQEREEILGKLERFENENKLQITTPKSGWHIKEFLLRQPPPSLPKHHELYDSEGQSLPQKRTSRAHDKDLCARFEKAHGQIITIAAMQKARFELDREDDEYLKASGGPEIALPRKRPTGRKPKKQK